MTEHPPTEQPPAEIPPAAVGSHRKHRWDAIGVVIASLVGLLALLVSGYTAYIQRQQVRAQVWPYLTRGYVQPPGAGDTEYKLALFNKGVGPAIVRNVQVLVDGKPQTTWKQVFGALGLANDTFSYSSLDRNVLSAGETLPILVFNDAPALSNFRRAFVRHAKMRICYCSTLGECWMFADRGPRGESSVRPMAECPKSPSRHTFIN